jgi:hypothetical protein
MRRIELPAGDAEIQWIEFQHGIAQAQTGYQVVQGQLPGVAEGLGLQRHFGVDTVPAIGLERHVGQYAGRDQRRCGSRQQRRRCLFGRLHGAGLRADQGAQVGHVEHLRHQVGFHRRALAAGVDLERPGDVAAAMRPEKFS